MYSNPRATNNSTTTEPATVCCIPQSILLTVFQKPKTLLQTHVKYVRQRRKNQNQSKKNSVALRFNLFRAETMPDALCTALFNPCDALSRRVWECFRYPLNSLGFESMGRKAKTQSLFPKSHAYCLQRPPKIMSRNVIWWANSLRKTACIVAPWYQVTWEMSEHASSVQRGGPQCGITSVPCTPGCYKGPCRWSL